MTTPEFNPARVDVSDPETFRRQLLDDDQRVREQFAEALAPELDQLAEGLSVCFTRMEPVHEVAAFLPMPHIDLTCAFTLGMVDDLIVSTKLLLAGKLPASGNMMRQAIEGYAMAILCSTDEDLVIVKRPKQGDLRGRYWKMVWADDRQVQGQRAVELLALNADVLGVKHEGVASLETVQKLYHPYSHCGRVTVEHRADVAQPGMYHLGGHFEVAKLEGYRSHMRQRIAFCRAVPPFLDHLLAMLSNIPPNPSAPA
ncbi:hypothetical protein DF044_38450 [Burkholderia contaminans]|uniref:hypothetical protein n=1 Tax=Burkholderia contaminans TaxID=488447 RepID=UPI000F5B330E|nr:hypothetical protein [Burkholderia contaminans]RQT01766.1 hypothetical protein DF044_38450 [Burkholderia contaminans]